MQVLAKLIGDVIATTKLGLAEATREALRHVVGAYGIALCSRVNPNILVAARMVFAVPWRIHRMQGFQPRQ